MHQNYWAYAVSPTSAYIWHIYRFKRLSKWSWHI